MTYESFLERVKAEIMPLLTEDVKYVSIQSTLKNNGVERDALIAVSESLNISPTIYLDSYYDQYITGRPFESILHDIATTYMEHKPEHDFDITQFMDWEKVKYRVVRKLINYDNNKEFVESMAHKRVEDLAVVYQVLVEDDVVGDAYATIAVQNQHLKMWNVELDELDKIADLNTNRLLPFTFQSLAEMIRDMMNGISLPIEVDLPMYYLGNKAKIHGAVNVLNEQAMDYVKELLGEEYYVIPSSIHEVLLLPYDIGYEYEDLEEMIYETNKSLVDETEILSDNAYVVDAVNHKLVLAKRYEEYKQELKLVEEKQKEKEKHIEAPKGPKL